jgi:hypothetical protein
MEMLQIAPRPPVGLAFEISDLLILQGWAEFHGVRMVVELDHWVEGEEYEEVVAFYAKDSAVRRWIIWRSAREIVVQALIGRTARFASVAEALNSLHGTRLDCGSSTPAPRAPRRPRRPKSPSAAARQPQHAKVVGDGAAAGDAVSSVH